MKRKKPGADNRPQSLVVVKMQTRFERVRDKAREHVLLRPTRYRIGFVATSDPLTFDVAGEWIRSDRVGLIARYWIIDASDYRVERILRALGMLPADFYRLSDVDRFLRRHRRRDNRRDRRRFAEEISRAPPLHPCSGLFISADRTQIEAWYCDNHGERMIGACRSTAPRALVGEWRVRMFRHFHWVRSHATCTFCVDGFVKTCLAIGVFNEFL